MTDTDNEKINRDKIISLAREYVESVDCSCTGDWHSSCWKCLFQYNLNFLTDNQESAHSLPKEFTDQLEGFFKKP